VWVQGAETSTLSKYFAFLTRLLTRAKADPTNTPRQKADMSVMALSNLLSANIDSALEYFVAMGYHEDLETRASFLKVLTNILNQVPHLSPRAFPFTSSPARPTDQFRLPLRASRAPSSTRWQKREIGSISCWTYCWTPRWRWCCHCVQ